MTNREAMRHERSDMRSNLAAMRKRSGMNRRNGFSTLELLLVIFILSLFGGIVSSTIIKSYSNNKLVETQSIVQTELNLAIDRLSRVLRSSTLILEATQTNFKIRGYPNSADTAPYEINFHLQNSSLKYSIIPPTGVPPNYTYNQNDAKYYTLVGKTSNSNSNPVFRYYDDQNTLLNFPVTLGSIKVVEPNLSALDATNILKTPIIVTTKITLRNFKTNL